MLLLDDPWETPGSCDIAVDAGELWYHCTCPNGTERIDDGFELDLDTGEATGFVCACWNGSSNENCEPDGEPGGGDPGGPGDPQDPGGPGTGTGLPDYVQLEIECDSTLRGVVGGCRIIKHPADIALVNVQWEFIHFDETVTSQGGESWTGPILTSGQVRVNGQISGYNMTAGQFVLTGDIEVEGRGWTWSGSLDMANAPPGQFDNCLDEGDAGRTFGTDCESGPSLFTPWHPESGHDRTTPSSGPNEGMWYVNSVNTIMELRAQLAKRYRADGDSYPVIGEQAVVDACSNAFGTPIPDQNNHSVNTACTQTQSFSDFVDLVWEHEEAHMWAGLSEAQKPQNDLHALLEDLVRAGVITGQNAEQQIEYAVLNLYNEIHERIYLEAIGTHTGQGAAFVFWLYDPSSAEWLLSQVSTPDH